MKKGLKNIVLVMAVIALLCSSCADNQAASNNKSKEVEQGAASNNQSDQGDIKAAPQSAEKVDDNQDNKLILYNLTLIDGTGAEPMEDMRIFISKDRIEKIVKAEDDFPEGYEKVDLKGYYVLPGFINTHVHCFYSERTLQNWLENGVTTVRELASGKGSDFAVRRDESNKNPKNARIVTASPILTAKGGYIPPFDEPVETSEEAVKKTHKYINMDADVIKIAIEDDLQGREWNMLSLDLIQSITKTAHEGNKKVAVHISHTRNLRLAIDGGVDELSHMVVEPMEEELAKEIANKGIYWVPTLELWQRVSKQLDLTWDQTAAENLSMFYKAGGKIALGTDYGGYSVPFDQGMPMTEIKAMKAAGITNMDIIISATQNAAYVCGMEDQIGTLEDGKIADLIVTKENPLEKLEVLSELYMVIHNGTIITKN